MRHTSSKWLRYRAIVITLSVFVGAALPLGYLPASAASADTTDTLGIDLSQSTGACRGGANGALYGLGDNGVPGQPVRSTTIPNL